MILLLTVNGLLPINEVEKRIVNPLQRLQSAFLPDFPGQPSINGSGAVGWYASGQCPGRKSVLEAELDRQFAASLELIQMPEEAVSFVVKALKESHYDKQEYRDRVVSQQGDLKNLESRLDACTSTSLMARLPLITTIKNSGNGTGRWRKSVLKLSSMGMQMTVIWMKG